MKLEFRDLRPEELEVRVGNTIKNLKGEVYAFQVMIYKTARADLQVLDETFGVFGWKNNYYQVKNTMVCSISIWDEEKKQWINKDNGGDDDFNTEQIKAELSDSMKRAGFNVGIGRKLYTLNKLYMVIEISDENTTKGRYAVQDIEYDKLGVTHIVIINTKTKKVVLDQYRKDIGKGNKVATTSQNAPKNHIPSNDLDKKSNVSMKEINASVNSMEEYVSPLDSDDITYIKNYYNNLSTERKEKFEIWLFTTVQETKIDRLDETKAKKVANELRARG